MSFALVFRSPKVFTNSGVSNQRLKEGRRKFRKLLRAELNSLRWFRAKSQLVLLQLSDTVSWLNSNMERPVL